MQADFNGLIIENVGGEIRLAPSVVAGSMIEDRIDELQKRQMEIRIESAHNEKTIAQLTGILDAHRKAGSVVRASTSMDAKSVTGNR